MTLIKCKMCGGDLHIEPGSTICECEYCGSKQTIPDTNDEKRLKLYERANRLRFNCEFDKAAGVYESIVAEFQTEAEAYWGLLLCKYGIEYVDDPKTGKKIPTCHRSSFDCVLDDNNFELVMENADTVSTSLYREQAKQIEELRKSIIEVSSKEDPYDIFICYKETAEDGERTLDSVLAQDVYDALTEKGYKVFFSRITLEDKLGQEYEPYIFAALNSAKVMLAFGTKYEYYNAVWVKNEWSRFLQLMEAGQKKTLIPCFKNIDAYDMPKEFSKLQALDMDKIGATQDLLRGIDKIFGRDKRHTEVLTGAGTIGDSNALVKRGYFCLEDGEWEKAIQYFDQAMDADPENAEIHLGLFLAKRKRMNLDEFLKGQIEKLSSVSSKTVLACKPNDEFINRVAKENSVAGFISEMDVTDQFLYKLTYESKVEELEKEKNIYADKDWVKAERYANGELLNNIQSTKKKHIDEIERQIVEEKKRNEVESEKIIKSYEDFLYKTEEYAKNQRFQAESKREHSYQYLCKKMQNANTENELLSIIEGLESLYGYNNSNTLIEQCNSSLVEVRRIEKEKRDAQREEKKGKAIKTISIVIPIIVVIAIIAVLIPTVIYPAIKNANEYKKAKALFDSESYKEAEDAFDSLGEYKDSETLSKEAVYCQAKKYFDNGEYDSATSEFNRVQNYKDAADMAKQSQYQKAEESYNQGLYNEAIDVWKTIESYSDSKDRITDAENAIYEADYQAAVKLMDEGNYAEASSEFEKLGDYSDSSEKINECQELINEEKYQKASDAKGKNDFKTAIDIYKELGNYKDSLELYASSSYEYAEKLMNSNNYKDAIDYYQKANRYSDAREKKIEAIYNYGCQLLDQKDYKTAYLQFNQHKEVEKFVDKLYEAEYGIVLQYKNTSADKRSNYEYVDTIYDYAEDLINEGYPGAQELYDELFSWKIDILAINNSETSMTNMSSVSVYDNIYFHGIVSGGPPYETFDFTYSGAMPNCDPGGGSFEQASVGDEFYVVYYYTSGYQPGTCSVVFKDSNGNKIGYASIRMN